MLMICPEPCDRRWGKHARMTRRGPNTSTSNSRVTSASVAVSMARGPAAGLAIVDALDAEGSLASYHLLPSVRGDLLAKLERFDEARADFEHAASLTRNQRERTLLLERAAKCAKS